MQRVSAILLSFAGSALLATLSIAEVLQSAGQAGNLWAKRDGAELHVGKVGGGEIRVELPPGASIRDLEPTAKGWLAAGRLPSGDGTDLLLIEGGEEGADLLPVPQRGSARYRGQPVLLLDNGHLTGLAWAAGQGPRELEIWAAAWQDGDWGPPELVSAKGPGSQVAPAGAVLEDGSWLLTWAAYDGEDDEIVASRRIGGRWTHPERIHTANEVPDLTPDVVRIDGGALAAWSWFDGNDYRVKIARWLGGRWSLAHVLGGKGSGEPGLMRTDDRVLLLFQSVVPMAWTAMDLDRAGIERRTAIVPAESYERPLLLLEATGGDVLRWPTGDRVLEWRDLP